MAGAGPARRRRRARASPRPRGRRPTVRRVVAGPSTLTVASASFANGGDNIGVYVPVVASAGAASLVGYSVVFLVLVSVWCALGLFVATRPPVARAFDSSSLIVLPVVLIAIGVVILVEGGAFGIG